MTKIAQTFEQHPVVKLFLASDADAAAAEKMKNFSRLIGETERILDSDNGNRIGQILNGTLSISTAAGLAKKRPYDVEVFKIRAIYKDKQQILNCDVHHRLALANTGAEEAQLQEERTTKCRNTTELQNVRFEQRRLRYARKRATILKAGQPEAVSHSLEEDAQYRVWMRWDYEPDQPPPQVAWDKILRFDKKTKVHTLKSSSQVFAETEVITITYAAEIAKATAMCATSPHTSVAAFRDTKKQSLRGDCPWCIGRKVNDNDPLGFAGSIRRLGGHVAGRDRDRESTERIVEPHALVYYENTWYIKTFCHLQNEVRTFMLHRIESAEMLSETFKPNPEIYEAAKPGNFLQFEKIQNIKIRFHRSIHDALYAKPLYKDQIIDFDETSEYLTLHLPECFEEVVLPWVLSQMGKAEIIEPENLRHKLAKKTYVICNIHKNRRSYNEVL